MIEEELKIIGIQIDGLRKLNAVEMEFAEKGLIQFRGKNKQGKTTVLDSFEILLRGNKYLESDMITHGKEKASIIGYIGPYEIKRVITKKTKTNRIEIKDKEGKALGKPQEFLDTLINELTFNPRPFLNKTPEQKLRFMMDFLKIDFTKINEDISVLETERLITGRDIKKIGELKPVEKVEKISISNLIIKKNEITASNDKRKAEYDKEKEKLVAEIREFNELQQERSDIMASQAGVIDRLKEKEVEIEEEIVALQAKMGECLKSQEEKTAIFRKLEKPEPEKSYEVTIEMPVLEDTLSVDTEINDAEEINIKAEAYNQYVEKKNEKQKEQKNYEGITTKIETLRDSKKKILRGVKIPIEGLEIREDGIYHNDIYSENWADSEALKISSELCLAMQPKLKALFLDEGECFDSDSLEGLKKWAIENDIQMFLTIVDSTKGESGLDVFYLEEGEVV